MKFNILLVLMMVLLGLVLLGCASKNKTASKTTTKELDEPLFQISYKLSKGRSRINPSYTIKLNGSEVFYVGQDNIPVLGERVFTLSNEEFQLIRQAYQESDFTSLEEDYSGRFRDLPVSTLEYQGHKVKFIDREAPEALLKLAGLLRGLVPEK